MAQGSFQTHQEEQRDEVPNNKAQNVKSRKIKLPTALQRTEIQHRLEFAFTKIRCRREKQFQ